MAGHEFYTARYHLIGDGNGLGHLATIVADRQHQLLSEDAPSRVNVSHCHFCPASHLLAKRRVLPRHGAGYADRYIGRCCLLRTYRRITTSVLAGREQLNGSAGRHYGALAKADAPLPDLPVR